MTDVPAKSFKKGYKFPIYPTEEQRILLEKTFGCCRYVYNRGIEETKRAYTFYQEHKMILPGLSPPRTTGYDFVTKLPGYKSDFDSLWLNEVSSVALQQTMLHLGDAFSRFYKARKGFPTFKKKIASQSFVLMGAAFDLREGGLKIARCKTPIKVGLSRELPSSPSNVTISRTPTGRYYASFLCEYTPKPTTGQGKIGIDLGLKDFLVTSDGVKIANPRPFLKAEKQLRRAQQSLSRKREGSYNRTKARLKVAHCHERITHLRRNFHHQLSRQLVNDNQVIGLEKLMVSNMSKNRHLAKSIQDVGWSSFTTMLDYKSAESQNCTLVYMDTWFPSSHICSQTQRRLDRKLKLSERSWGCPHCGEVHDRDVNAAQNILNEALRVLKEHNVPDHAGLKVLAKSQRA